MRNSRKDKQEWTILDGNQIKALIDAAYNDSTDGDGLGLAIELACKAGARKGEILGANWCDFAAMHEGSDRLRWRITKTKQGKVHHYDLPIGVSESFQAYRKKFCLGDYCADGYHSDDCANRPVFVADRDGSGSEKRRDDFRSAWTRIKKAADIPSRMRIHDMRHTFGTQLAIMGYTAPQIQTAMGHASYKTT